ncbi:hypothetical protein [Corynebacterium liangguodongii]|uniref:Uncharacterized protein n=1 Tax=Corynebacterium liangguodongii TaxID=2079535 RepID=A0A2S0WFS5_9CORY|nr:hypothetical protein [Corynebacterium liangguodongii]AWB84635.1 hypothetical protein C3E79_09250 [Corynebacterium liangguodongii]PWB99643.1 hypothetical protein DF219_05030 [Corynebacterium liangguodongii]
MNSRRAPIALALAASLALPGCGSDAQDSPLIGQTWQVVAVHTDPLWPGELPADAAGKAELRVSGSSLRATTGCAPLRARVERGDQDPDRLTLHEVELGEVGACDGGSRHVHDQLTGLLTEGAQFDVRMFGEREATLTVVGDAVDRASIRVMAL